MLPVEAKKRRKNVVIRRRYVVPDAKKQSAGKQCRLSCMGCVLMSCSLRAKAGDIAQHPADMAWTLWTLPPRPPFTGAAIGMVFQGSASIPSSADTEDGERRWEILYVGCLNLGA